MLEVISQFHFLRPIWLVGILSLPFIWWLLVKRQRAGSEWSKVIAPELLVHLTPQDSNNEGQKQNRLAPWLVIVTVFLMSVSMAGPSWQKLPAPVSQIEDNMVVILDLSISMFATDQKPNRLVKAKQKLRDLLKLRTEGNTALVAFSGDAHVVTPLTDDVRTITANLPALEPGLLPVIGSRPDLAVDESIALLQQAGATNGRIVLITDGVANHQTERIEDSLKKTPYALSVLGIGTQLGGPINFNNQLMKDNNGSVIIPKVDFNELRTLAQNNGGVFAKSRLDDQDLKILDIEGTALKQSIEEAQKDDASRTFDIWDDAGVYLVWLILPLCLIAHRQGALLLLLIALVPLKDLRAEEPEQKDRSLWSKLWQTNDQYAQQQMDQGNIESAAAFFDATDRKGFAQFRSGNFEAAAQSYSQSENAEAKYNEGNALAHARDFEAALEAYEKVLEELPEHENAAFNKKLIEDFLKNQPPQDSSQSDSSQDQQNQNSQSQDQQSPDGSESDQNSSQDQNSQNESSEDQNSQEQQSQEQNSQQKAEEQTPEQSEKDNQLAQEQQQENDESGEEERLEQTPMDKLSQEEKQSYEQWMRRVPDDPGGLLRRKFQEQSRSRNRIDTEEGEPLY